MIPGLTAGDWDYLRSYSNDMRKCHEREFVKYINPSLMRAMYRGRTKYENFETETYGDSDANEHVTALVTLFQATNTLLPNRYFQNPSPIVKAGRGSNPDDAALLTSALKKYMKLNSAKRQNQEAVLNDHFFGFGVKKMGWRAVYSTPQDTQEGLPEEPRHEQQAGPGIIDTIKGFLGGGQVRKPDNLESKESPDLADFETMFNDSESPMNIAFDHKTDMLNMGAILHSLPRCLYDLENSANKYDTEVLKELFEALRNKYGSKFDSRNTELHLRELHMKSRDGIYITTWVDEWDNPISHFKSDAKVCAKDKKFLFEILSTTFEPGVRYPTSYMKVASQVQKKADDLLSLYVEIVARSMNLVVVNEKALANGQLGNLEKNLVRGLIKTKGPINPQDLAHFSSGTANSDLPNLIGLLQKKIAEVLGADEQLVFGNSDNDTLGQDELARSGTKVREAGARDRVRDWMIEQAKKETSLLRQYSNSELHLQIEPSDYSDQNARMTAKPRQVSFMTQDNPLGLKSYIPGEFEHDFNMDEAVRPDKASQRKAFMELLEISSNPQIEDSCIQQGFRFRKDKIAIGLAGTMDNVINPEEYIERLDPMQAAAIQAQRVMMASPQAMRPQPEKKQGKAPSESGASNPSSVEANT